MSNIVRITCGQMPCTLPNGKQVSADYYELRIFDHGADFTYCKDDSNNSLGLPDDSQTRSALASVLRQTDALLAAYPDEQPFPDIIPIAKEVELRDGIVRYAPKEELLRILTQFNKYLISLTELPQLQGLVMAPQGGMGLSFVNAAAGNGNLQTTLPMLQGLVNADCRAAALAPSPSEIWNCSCGEKSISGKFCPRCASPRPKQQPNIIRISLNSDPIHYEFRAKTDSSNLSIHAGSSLLYYSFPPAYPAWSAAEEKLLQTALSDQQTEHFTGQITFSDGTERFADAEMLAQLLADLAVALGRDEENVKVKEINDVNQHLQPQGLVSYNPNPINPMSAFMGMGMMMGAPQPQLETPVPVLHEDGTWDCSCGTKGLTGKFCFDCGRQKPQKNC